MIETNNEKEFYILLRSNPIVCLKTEVGDIIVSCLESSGNFYGNYRKIRSNRKLIMLVDGNIVYKCDLESFRGNFIGEYVKLLKKYIKYKESISRIGFAFKYVDDKKRSYFSKERKKIVGAILKGVRIFNTFDFNKEVLSFLVSKRLMYKIDEDYRFVKGFLKEEY